MTRTTSCEEPAQAFRIRPFRPGEEAAIIQVLSTVFGEWPAFDLQYSSESYWHWRYLELPGTSTHVFVCEVGGQIVGCLHHTFVDLKIGDRFYPGTLGGDIAVLRPFREKGLTAEFSKLARSHRRETGRWFTFFETHNQNLIDSFSKTAFQLPIKSRHLLRVKNIKLHLTQQKHAWRGLKVFAFKAMKTFNTLVHYSRNSQDDGALHLSVIETFDARIDKFWERISNHYRLILKRDRRYLNWRYCDARGGNYQVKCVEEDGRFVGYIVLRINRKNPQYPTAYIVDLLCEPGREDAAQALLADGLRYFDQQGVNAVHCLVPHHHPYRKIYTASGFVDTLERNIVFLRANMPLDKPLGELDSMDFGQAYHSYGDIDTI